MDEAVIRMMETANGFRADLTVLPGSPPCGDGRTKEEALTSLFGRLLAEENETFLEILKSCRSFKLVMA